MMYYYNSGPGAMMGWGPFGFAAGILHLVFWLFIILLVIRLFRWKRHHKGEHYMWGRNNALEILRERYAKGEINREEFEERKKDLM